MARFGLDAVKDLAPTDVGPSPELARYIRDRIPPGGLFAGLKWRISSTPFVLGPALMAELEMMGRVLLQFHRSANRLYRESVMGQQPAWVAEWLDRGKSEQLVQWQRSPALKNDIPRVIRPDLLLTEDGLCLVELDSVPGGIGLTAWLNETYARAGAQTVGGADGMLLGFASQFGNAPRVHIVLSDEAGTYRPEMQWLCQRLNQMPGLSSQFEVREVSYRDFGDGDAVYRFFELFDLANVPNAALLFERAISNRLRVTPPPKPIFEEKMLFALLWNWNLREFWRRELGESFFLRMRRWVPYTWLVDPAPLPPQAAIPELNLTDWQQLKSLSKRERQLILKVSGFSELAWGARGVHLGSDLSLEHWSAAVDTALESASRSPYVLQRYHKPRIVRTDWFDFERNEWAPMEGRVRLCPYFFVAGEGDAARARLCGILATVCPADKKIIHGMTEAVLAPGGP